MREEVILVMVVRGDGDDVAANLYCGCVTFASRQAVVTL